MSFKAQTLFGCVDGAGGDVVVLGLPFDLGSTGHHGCAQAPAVLRSYTAGLQHRQGHFFDQGTRRKLLDDAHLSDLGDAVPRAQVTRERYLDHVAEVSERAHAEGKRVLGLGGDHLVCLPLIRGAARARGALQVLQLDAHTDYQPADAHEVASHANFVHFLAADPLVSRITVVGVRGYSRDLYPLPEKHRAVSLEQIAQTLLPGVPVYLTVDTDAFDPSIAPAVGHPQLHGLPWSAIGHALAAIERAGCELVGADWTEYNPEYDTRNHLTALGIVESLIAITGTLAKHHARSRELARVA